MSDDKTTAEELPLRIEYVPLSEVKLWKRNPKTHDVDAIRKSMARWGVTWPILPDERTGKLVAGHGRIKSLTRKKNDGEEPPERIIVREDGEWMVPVIRGVAFKDDTEAEAYGVADNRTTELGGWDNEALVKVLADLNEKNAMEGVGYSEDEFTNLFNMVQGDPTALLPSSNPPQDRNTQVDVVVCELRVPPKASKDFIEELRGFLSPWTKRGVVLNVS